jgi:hypothetical protein
MASENRRSVIDHTYTLCDGRKKKRSELIQMIRQSIKEGNFTSSQIARHIKLRMKHVGNIIRHMIDQNIILASKPKNGGSKYVFALKDECLLADMFYPKPNDIDKMFKVKSRTVRNVNQGTSKSEITKGITKYQQSYYDSVYWG